MDSKFCMYCNLYYNNIVDHCINTCAYLEMERANLWLEILEISIQAYIFAIQTEVVFLRHGNCRVCSNLG